MFVSFGPAFEGNTLAGNRKEAGLAKAEGCSAKLPQIGRGTSKSINNGRVNKLVEMGRAVLSK